MACRCLDCVTTAICGIFTAAFYTGPFAFAIRIALYLIMGWTAILPLPQLSKKLGTRGVALLVGGGVAYTLGVPFCARNAHTFTLPDHAIWHIFVMLGTAFHYFCIFYYVIDYDEKTDFDAETGASDNDMDEAFLSEP
eukprot:TRINITY_DN15021_c0_g1_i1.p2 TRINITY_DN15021_c0_g1~~TRINITY_DN15021_c0_g1_i1.p2  ORF type:complete len:138 (-),score=15.26 TRINITY_DN15021_c0_g1_i1:454-867(-)